MAQDTAPGRPQNLAGQVQATAAVIVVGLDGSPTSWDAFAWAAGEANARATDSSPSMSCPQPNPQQRSGCPSTTQASSRPNRRSPMN